ncbi:helix-turn-helix domain-containing protein [Mycolicibacterium wolinskyi]|uniref:AlbA family DNA-binding domain-containing protein n=1 Tax=Mycolicibacterium wolinskyi TaxID=59750 RepID=UPI003917B540
MPRFPRLCSVFGVDIADLDAPAVHSAIQRGEVEDLDLDWKEADYPKDKNFEIAKDVAALANTRGGVIIIGVRENSSGRAVEAKPFKVSPKSSERVSQALGNRVSPLLHEVDIREIPAGDGLGYLLITVPHSSDAPHAVRDHPDGPLHYPIRLGRTTHYLSEYEVAARYRDRQASAAESIDRLDTIHAEGVSRIALFLAPWLAVSIVPRGRGERGVGSAALAGEQSFIQRWPREFPPYAQTCFHEHQTKLIPGIRRAIATQTRPYNGLSKHPHAELHYDGGGFAASFFASPPPDTRSVSNNPDEIRQDHMEHLLLELLLFLSHRAIDCGASGECLIKAQQLLPQQTGPHDVPMRTRVMAPERTPKRYLEDSVDYFQPEGSLVLSGRQTHAASVSASLDELTAQTPRATVIAAHALAADILGEFGVVEPMLLRPDGSLRLTNASSPLMENLQQWGLSRGLEITAPKNYP